MKIFQIVSNVCYWDATAVHPTLADTVGKYPSDIIFVEAPDYVFEGWGYDSTKVGLIGSFSRRLRKDGNTTPRPAALNSLIRQRKILSPPTG